MKLYSWVLCVLACLFCFFAIAKDILRGFPGGSVVKNPPDNAGDTRDAGSIPGLGRSAGEGNGYPFQYSCPGNPMDRGAWQAIVRRIAKSQT